MSFLQGIVLVADTPTIKRGTTGVGGGGAPDTPPGGGPHFGVGRRAPPGAT
jgi:hypothetical protein